MTAKRKVVKKSIKVPRGTISRITYTPPKLPDKPPVDQGAKSYGRSRSGQYIIPRFFVSNLRGYKAWNRWWVWDMEEARVASKTEKDGYRSKKEAVKVAEHHRDKYGAWALIPF